MQRFLKQFSFPGHIGSHCTPETLGSIHPCGAVFDNHSLIALAHAHKHGMDADDVTNWRCNPLTAAAHAGELRQ